MNPLFAPGGLLETEPAHTIHPRAVNGRHARWRWAVVALTQLFFYGLPWLTLDGQPAVWLDLEGRRFFLFGAVLFPQDLVWLSVLLVASALALFLATAVAGRVWCGFACPQTVYTALFVWIEQRCEGDRLARQRLDAAPWGLRKLGRRGGKQLLWVAFSVWTGLTLVGWFTPIRQLLAALPAGLGPWETFCAGGYALATWAHAGVLREKVCQHMCPYGRFQGSMLDTRTLNVSYDARRGEPRGHRGRGDDAAALGLGSCVDCTLCVQVCPTGVDIRQGLQSGCINCGLCIDACDGVMDRLGQPRGLIRFASLQELARPLPAGTVADTAPAAPLWRRALDLSGRPRVALYAGLLALSLAALVAGLATRPTLRLDAMRDRSVLAREVEDGAVENVYQLLLINASAQPRRLRLSAAADPEGPALPGLALLGADEVLLAPAHTRLVAVRLRLPAGAVAGGRQVLPVWLQARAVPVDGQGPGEQARTRSTFIVP